MNDNNSLTTDTVNAFNNAFNRHDVDEVMKLMTEDCIFENTNPAPDGARYEGQQAVRSCWEKFFSANPDASFEAEEVITADDRCIVRWIYRKTREGHTWHLRGVDIFRVKEGKVAEKLAYVKG
ncbi:MAG TPA: nuclear transport factor 2 family protein [Puia sp.]|nr:nuclear transport factor 2 family protein [Puia sp.]